MPINRIRVKEAMAAKGIATQTELAKRLGISKNQMSVILSEKYNPIKSRVEEMCRVLDVPPSFLVDLEAGGAEPAVPEYETDVVTAVELFAGAGGLALGLEQAGIKTLAFVEIDKACCETLRANRPRWNIVNQDIGKVDFTKYRNRADIVTGGFPCQAFSYAGKKLGFDDIRGTLFYEFARCVKEIQPVIFLAENVRGLISHDKGRTLGTILDVLENLGYHVAYRVLNAAYYGVAQKRERVVIVGCRDGVQFDYPEPAKKMTLLWEALKDCPVSEGQSYSQKKQSFLRLIPPGGSWVNLPLEKQKEYLGKSFYSGGGKRGMARRISWDEPCLTLTCSPSQKQTERCHPDETRPFTVREYARIQSFPDDWNFSGGMGEKYKQIGNAVPVRMARRLGEQLVIAVRNYTKGH